MKKILLFFLLLTINTAISYFVMLAVNKGNTAVTNRLLWAIIIGIVITTVTIFAMKVRK